MKIVKKKIEKLVSVSYNQKKLLTKECRIQELKRSFKEEYAETVIWEKTKLVLGGYHRLKVLKNLGY